MSHIPCAEASWCGILPERRCAFMVRILGQTVLALMVFGCKYVAIFLEVQEHCMQWNFTGGDLREHLKEFVETMECLILVFNSSCSYSCWNFQVSLTVPPLLHPAGCAVNPVQMQMRLVPMTGSVFPWCLYGYRSDGNQNRWVWVWAVVSKPKERV